MYNPAQPSPAEIAAGYASERFRVHRDQEHRHRRPCPLGGLRPDQRRRLRLPELRPGTIATADDRARPERAGRGQRSGLPHALPRLCGGSSPANTPAISANAGEKIELDAPIGGVIQEFTYEDGWYGHDRRRGLLAHRPQSVADHDPLGLQRRLAGQRRAGREPRLRRYPGCARLGGHQRSAGPLRPGLWRRRSSSTTPPISGCT